MGYVRTSHSESKTDRRYLTGICGEANVRTPLGPKRIEMLQPGDMVVTRNSGLQPVRMIWTRTVTPLEMRASPELAPIRLKPRAVGPMMPSRDLRMACGHRALIPGYRIAGAEDDQSYLMRVGAVAMSSDAAFCDRKAEQVTYYNLVFDSHQVFCAEGLPIESFLPSPKSISLLDLHTRTEMVELFPELTRKRAAYPCVSHPVAQRKAHLEDASL